MSMKRVLKTFVMVCMLTVLAVMPGFTASQMKAEAAAETTVTLKNPTNLKLTQYLNRGFVIKWSKVKNATGYEIYLKTATAKKYTKVGQTKSNLYQITNLNGKSLKANQKYKIAVRAYKTVKGKKIYGEFSTLTATANNIDILEVHGRCVQATVQKRTTVTVNETGEKYTFNPGTKLAILSRQGDYNTVILNSGRKATVKRADLSFSRNQVTTNKYYTTAQKELFVNSKNFSSPTGYLIWINQYTLNTTIFKGSTGKWKVIRSMPCVVGRSMKTPTGLTRIVKKCYLYGNYALYFTWNPYRGWGNAFHRRMGDGQTRSAVSNGCVRLGNEDLAFMYNTCPVGTTVYSN